MRWYKALLLTTTLCCGLALLPGCKPSPALEQLIYDQQAPHQDPDSQTKLVDNRADHQERDDSLSPKDLEEDSPDQRERVNEDPVPGPTGSDLPAPDVEHDESGESDLPADTAPDPAGTEADTGEGAAPQSPPPQGDGSGASVTTDGGAEDGGTGTQGTGTVPTGGDAVRQVVNAFGAVVEVPQEVETVAAVGEAALMVQMLGGPDRLAAADESFLSQPLAASVFADEGFDQIVPLWPGDGGGGLDDASFASLLELAPQACLELSGQPVFSEAQIAALEEAGIAYVVLPSLNTSSGLKQAVTLTGELLGRLNGVDREIADQAMEDMGVTRYRDTPYTDLSGGERQLVMIARALAQEPALLVLDEPTASLDYGNMIRVMEKIRSLKEKGYAVVMTTHLPDQAFLCGASVVLLRRDGPLLFGPAEQVVTEKNLKDAYGVRVKIMEFAGTDGHIQRLCAPMMHSGG